FDPDNGLMGRNKPDTGDFDQVGGTFNYAFLYETFNRRMPYPKERIDSVLGLQQADGYWHPANRIWLTLDALYLLTRGLRHTPHRFDDVRKAVRQLMTSLMDDVFSVQGRIRSFSGKLPTHTVMAALSIAAE